MRGRYFRDISIVRADDGERTVPTPEENEVVIFRSFFKAGLRFPLNRFVVEVLKISMTAIVMMQKVRAKTLKIGPGDQVTQSSGNRLSDRVTLIT